MSRAYEFNGNVFATSMDQANRIIKALKEFDMEFDTEELPEFHFDNFCGDCTVRIPSTALYASCGTDDGDIAKELKKVIWEAAGEYVEIHLQSIELDERPWDNWDSDEDEYDEFKEEKNLQQ